MLCRSLTNYLLLGHPLAAKKKVELLKACGHNDGAATKTALNHIVLEDTYWRPEAATPLIAAIRLATLSL